MTVTFQAQAGETGADYESHVQEWLTDKGYTVIGRNVRHASGVEFDLEVEDWRGNVFGVECKASRPDTPVRNGPGMYRSDNKWKVLGYLYLLRAWREKTGESVRYMLITSHLPPEGHATRDILNDAVMLGDLQAVYEVPCPAKRIDA